MTNLEVFWAIPVDAASEADSVRCVRVEDYERLRAELDAEKAAHIKTFSAYQWLAEQHAGQRLAVEPSEQCGSLGERSVIGCELPKGHAGLCDYEDPRADWEKESPPSSADQHRPPCDNPHCCICDGPAQRTNASETQDLNND